MTPGGRETSGDPAKAPGSGSGSGFATGAIPSPAERLARIDADLRALAERTYLDEDGRQRIDELLVQRKAVQTERDLDAALADADAA